MSGFEIQISWHSDPNTVKEVACDTVDLIPVSPITQEALLGFLVSEHSPIRAAELKIKVRRLNYFTHVHFRTHVHTLHFVKTSRPDRTNRAQRSLDDTVNHTMIVNAQALIDMMRKRLCRPPIVAPETHKVAMAIAMKLRQAPDPLMRMMGVVLVPNCVYRAGCPEGERTCGWYAFNFDPAPTIMARYYKYIEILEGEGL